MFFFKFFFFFFKNNKDLTNVCESLSHPIPIKYFLYQYDFDTLMVSPI